MVKKKKKVMKKIKVPASALFKNIKGVSNSSKNHK